MAVMISGGGQQPDPGMVMVPICLISRVTTINAHLLSRVGQRELYQDSELHTHPVRLQVVARYEISLDLTLLHREQSLCVT